MSIGAGTSAARHGLDPGKPPGPGKAWKLALAGVIVAFVVLAAYDLVTNYSQIGATAAPSASPARSPAGAAGRPSAAARATAGRSGPSPAPSPAGSPAPRPLGVVSVAAFGPDGAPDGDNPGLAGRILDAGTAQPWYSQWYATPEFGGLRSGTGLLLDLGATETVTDVRLTLGSAPGTDVQVRVGGTPSAGLPTVAGAADAGGDVRLSVHPAKGRYVLIWFTRLPPDGQGHYQVSVYSVSVEGVPA